jgi:hypothetical protein
VGIGNGRDPARFHPDAEARSRIRAEFGVPEDQVVVIIVSRLVRHKGHPELLAAMQEVNAELWVVGERLASDHGEDLEPTFAACRLGKRLRRLGQRAAWRCCGCGSDGAGWVRGRQAEHAADRGEGAAGRCAGEQVGGGGIGQERLELGGAGGGLGAEGADQPGVCGGKG